MSLPASGYNRDICWKDAGFTLPDNDGSIQRSVKNVDGVIVFTSGLRVNTDGAPNSYHPIGKPKGALNTICNGIAITPGSGPYAGVRISSKWPEEIAPGKRCQMILDAFRPSRDADYAISADVRIDWYAIAHLEPKDGRYRPCVQTGGPFKGFFVAQTAMPADDTKETCDVQRWLASSDIPYVTLPGSALAAHGVTPGDLALVHRKSGDTDHWVVAVAGDTGNKKELGEGSIALHAALGRTWKGRIPGNIENGVTTYLFPKMKADMPISNATLQSRKAELMGRIGGGKTIGKCR